jgi:protein-S-isoprenylcysteine O-methyltransferase Ste14
MKDQKKQDQGNSDTRKNISRRLLQVSFSVIITATILLVSAGRFNLIYLWVYIVTSLLVILINALIFPSELISERGRKKENVEKWDRIITGIIIFPWLIIYLIAGLDIRFGWSPGYPIWIHLAGLIAFIAGNAFVSWAMISNNYFSTSVRIQYDRGHTVSSGGPYKYIRHPGYVGMIVYLFATPVLLGSLWALIPTVLTIILFIVRAAFEDNTLKKKLEGYKEYSETVKYRLIPGIW